MSGAREGHDGGFLGVSFCLVYPRTGAEELVALEGHLWG